MNLWLDDEHGDPQPVTGWQAVLILAGALLILGGALVGAAVIR